jgi:hypothetical protein
MEEEEGCWTTCVEHVPANHSPSNSQTRAMGRSSCRGVCEL